MKRALLTLAGLSVLALGLVTAPAFSGRPGAPRASDFEMAAPAVVAARAGGFTSPELRAPRRFDLVGMRWTSRARPVMSVRTRRAGHAWLPWTRLETDPGDAPDRGSREHSPRGFTSPLWTGPADFVQYRLSRPVAGLRLHFVSVPLVLPGARESRNAQTAQTPGEPPIQPRSAWGADACVPRDAPQYGQVQAAFIHHTVSANDYTQEEVPSIILSICRYHRNNNGWNDIGYNFLVDKFGTIWEGRAGGVDQAVVGAQAQGYNSQTTGIADIGDHQDAPADDAELNAIAALVRWKLPLHGVPTQGTVTLMSGGGSLNRYPAGTPVTVDRIAGHRDGDSTACPGDALYAQLPDLRARVGNVTPSQARTLIDATLTPGQVVYPEVATLSGTLRQINGDPVPGAPLAVQAYGTSGWRTAWQATTGDDGSFSVPVGARMSHMIRVVFGGDPARLASTSKPIALTITPGLSLARSASREPVGQTVTLSGSIQPSKARLQLLVERRVGKQKTRGTLALPARGGHFRRTYRFQVAGLFRFQVAFKGDAQNGAAASTSVYVRATPAVVAPTSGNGGVISGANPGRAHS